MPIKPNHVGSGVETRAQKHIVIIGGGFAGIAAARALERAPAEVVLIDRRNHHIFQPLLYQVATGVLAPSEIAAPIRQLAVKQSNLTVVLAEVTGVDLNSRTVDANCQGLGTRKILFDFLVVATGMRPSYFGHDEFAQYAPGLKNLNDAELIRTKILSAFELAEATDDAGERDRQMTFVLVGAGPTGVELAGSIAHMVAVTLRRNFRRINPAESTIVLLEGGDCVLPSFAETLSRKATQRLEKLGIKVMTGVKVEAVDELGVIAGGKRIPSATVLWTAGVAASPISESIRRQDRSGRPRNRWSAPGTSRGARHIRHRRYGVGHAGGTPRARGRPGSDPARAICGTLDLRASRGARSEPSIPIFRQRQYGRSRQELCDPRGRPNSHERVPDLADMGIRPRGLASPAAESIARRNPMALVIPHRSAQLTPDFRAVEDGGGLKYLCPDSKSKRVSLRRKGYACSS